MEFPVEVWSRVVAHADFADVSRLHDTCVDLRQEALKRLHIDPPTILVAMENDSVVLMRASITLKSTSIYLTGGLITLALRHEARRIMVNYIAPLDPKPCITRLVEAEWFDEAEVVRKRNNISTYNLRHYWVLRLHIIHEEPERSHILRRIIEDCTKYDEQSFKISASRVNDYLNIVHPLDLPDLVWKAAEHGYSYNYVILREPRDSQVKTIIMQYEMGNKRSPI